MKHSARAAPHFILNKISDQTEKKVVAEVPIPLDYRIAVTIYKLSRDDYIYKIGEMCGLGKGNVCTIVSKTCTVIINTLWDDIVKRPSSTSEDDIRHYMRKFDKEWQFPFAFSAVDGSHLPIKCPIGRAQAMKQYINFKNFYLIVLMALANADYRFIWTSVGDPGNTHDSTLLQSTDLWNRIVEER